MQYVEIGGAPAGEQCAQLGSRDYNYSERAHLECDAFIAQLKRQFGPPPEGARIGTKSNAHDFGTYYEVVVYHDGSEAAVEYAYNVENNAPDKWDEQARKDMNLWPLR